MQCFNVGARECIVKFANKCDIGKHYSARNNCDELIKHTSSHQSQMHQDF